MTLKRGDGGKLTSVFLCGSLRSRITESTLTIRQLIELGLHYKVMRQQSTPDDELYEVITSHPLYREKVRQLMGLHRENQALKVALRGYEDAPKKKAEKTK